MGEEIKNSYNDHDILIELSTKFTFFANLAHDLMLKMETKADKQDMFLIKKDVDDLKKTVLTQQQDCKIDNTRRQTVIALGEMTWKGILGIIGLAGGLLTIIKLLFFKGV